MGSSRAYANGGELDLGLFLCTVWFGTGSVPHQGLIQWGPACREDWASGALMKLAIRETLVEPPSRCDSGIGARVARAAPHGSCRLPRSSDKACLLRPVYKTGWVAPCIQVCSAAPTPSPVNPPLANNPRLYNQSPPFNTMTPPFTARLGSRGSSQPTQVPTSEQLVGQWYMTASSSSFWQVGKHSTCLTYQLSTAAPGALDDMSTYVSDGSNQPSTTKGVSSPSAAGPGIYDWRGAGWLRMIRTSWEVVGWGALEGGGDEEEVLVTLAAKTIFSPRALSVFWRKREGMGEERIQVVAAALKALGDANLTLDADGLRAIPQTWPAE